MDFSTYGLAKALVVGCVLTHLALVHFLIYTVRRVTPSTRLWFFAFCAVHYALAFTAFYRGVSSPTALTEFLGAIGIPGALAAMISVNVLFRGSSARRLARLVVAAVAVLGLFFSLTVATSEADTGLAAHRTRLWYISGICAFWALPGDHEPQWSLPAVGVLFCALGVCLASLAKFLLILTICIPALMLLAQFRQARYATIPVIGLIAIGLVTLLLVGDAVAQRLGYQDIEHFIDVRVTREHYAMNDYKVFGLVSDGGRLALIEDYLGRARGSLLYGLGFGVHDIVDVPEHNVLLFFVVRYGIIPTIIYMVFIAILVFDWLTSQLRAQSSKRRAPVFFTLAYLSFLTMVGEAYSDPILTLWMCVTFGFVVAGTAIILIPHERNDLGSIPLS